MELDKYKIIRELGEGQGGFGRTYLAECTRIPGKPKRVLKYLYPHTPPTNDQGWQILRRLFRKEAEILKCLGRHSQIPTFYEYIAESGHFAIVQEYIPGKTLDDEFKHGAKQNQIQVLDVLEEILEVLKFVHDQNSIHLDLKLGNMMRRSTDRKVVLIDFGGAKQVGALQITPGGGTKLTICVGTQGYTPPEQSSRRPKPSSDVYAIGRIAIRLLTGIEPSRISEDPMKTGSLLWRSYAGEVNQDFVEVIEKMTSYDHRNRYQNAREALDAIQRLRKKIQADAIAQINKRNRQMQADAIAQINKRNRPINQRSSNKNGGFLDLLGFPFENSLSLPMYLGVYSLGYSLFGFIAGGFALVGSILIVVSLTLLLILGVSVCASIPSFREVIYTLGFPMAALPLFIAWQFPNLSTIGLGIPLAILLSAWFYIVSLGKEKWQSNDQFLKEIIVRCLLALPGTLIGAVIGVLVFSRR
jgi:serine/threonine protein kinase